MKAYLKFCTVMVYTLCIGNMVGCGRDKKEISTYTVPRESKVAEEAPSAHAEHSGAEHASHSQSETVSGDDKIRWTVPESWVEQPPSSMRIGSFTYGAKNGQAVDISVVALPGDAGGLLANVNRWRSQIELSPLDDAGLQKAMQKLPLADREIVMVEFVSADNLIEGTYKIRLVAAVLLVEDTSYFFKMTGEDSAVNENGGQFIGFLETLTFS